jgi:hypothetical protein
LAATTQFLPNRKEFKMHKVARIMAVLGLVLGLTLVLALGMARPARAATITVDTTSDVLDAAGSCGAVTFASLPGPDGNISLREAVCAASNDVGADTINFDGSLAGQTIIITGTSGLTIQSANGDNTIIDGDVDGDGDADVTLTYGGATPGISGIRVRSSDNVIESLIIQEFSGYGIYVQSYSSSPFTADNNVISNTVVISNSFYGIYVDESTSGGSADGTQVLRSRVSGNLYYGIRVKGAANTEVLTNVIGLDAAGTAAQPNGTAGDKFDGLNLSGATTSTVRANTISGNERNGIFIDGGAFDNIIAGNKIGTDVSGLVAIPNGTGKLEGRDGIQCSVTGGHHNIIGGTDPLDANVIGGNTRAGIFFNGSACYNNEVYGNYIGTNSVGADLGNGSLFMGGDAGDAGVEIEDGAHDNIVGGTAVGQPNVVRFNMYGVRLSGFNGAPQNNQVVSNTITSNDIHGVVNQLTHRNTFSTTPALGDNLIAYNVITDNAEVGIFNWGASPRIVTNTITNNGDFGIANRVYFSETNRTEDLLAIPYVAGNLLDANGNDDVFSRDTAPLNKYTVHLDNDFGSVGGDARVSQRWFGAVEVLSGTATLNGSTNLTVTIGTFAATRSPCPQGAADCTGSTYDQVNAAPEQGIWGPVGIDYVDIEDFDDGTTSWFELREYEVEANGAVITYSKMLVTVDGDRIGAAVFSFDGISTTEPVSPDSQLLFCENTGILSDPAHSLCRYQIAEVVAQPLGGDADGDGIPDADEGTGDADGDGTPDFQDTDSDNDGIDDSVEGDGDADGDGTPNYQDTDSDDDGISDADEGTGDTDGDGIPDYLENNDNDADGDGTPDYQDNDSDGDGILDGDECTTPNACEDSDGDGIPDYLESNDNDADGDGTPDYQDQDSDGDGVPDSDEWGSANCPSDPDNPACDADDDGIPDYLESNDNDADGDGTPDYQDQDSDGDGILDEDEWGEANCPADADAPACDADDDGIPDYLESDTSDSDGDGTPDAQDTDSDGDGIPDSDEWGQANCPSDSDAPACDADDDGIPDYLESDTRDTDGDGLVDSEDTDADGDGTLDEDEWGEDDCPTDDNAPACDTDDDGVPDWLDQGDDDTDSDDDTISDGDEFWTTCPDGADTTIDTDGDGVPNCADYDADDGSDPPDSPNHLDTDADDDGVPDSEEAGDADLGTPPVDTDGDGVPDYLDPDSDNDGWLDGDDPNRTTVDYRLFLPVITRNY